jgi:hypothetical protein
VVEDVLESVEDDDDPVPPSFEDVLDSVDLEAESPPLEDELLRPLADPDEERESVMYQPLPLKTMPTGWMTLRSAPPHCSQVVRGGSEKLCRFSMRSLQAVQV